MGRSHIFIMFNNTLHVYAAIFHRVNIDVPASVVALPLDTQLANNSMMHTTWLSGKNLGQTVRP